MAPAEWLATIARADRAIGAFGGAPFLAAPGGPGALENIAVGIKNNIDISGLPTGNGLGGVPLPSATDAPVVLAVRQAGAVLLGGLRMDEAALGASGENPHFGRIANPRNLAHSPGGSSGGAAAAVAAGFCQAALGTDTMGSVRIPASYCGVFGFKPTRDAIPRAGVAALAPSLDHVGILAADLDILRRVFAICRTTPPVVLKPRRIGVVAGATGVVESAIGTTQRKLVDLGYEIVESPLAWNAPAARRAAFLLTEIEAATEHADALARADSGLSDTLRRMLIFGRDCDSARRDHMRETLADVSEQFARALDDCDALLLPTTSHTAFAWADGAPPDQADWTVPANILGIPALSLPCGNDAAGLPIGLQLLGRTGADDALLALAAEMTHQPDAR